MRRVVWSGLCCFALGALGCTRQPEVTPPVEHPATAVTPTLPQEPVAPREIPPEPVLVVQSELTYGSTDGSHAIPQVRSVTFAVSVTGFTASKDVVVRFTSPDGETFQRTKKRGFGVPDLQRFAFELPVAGTMIDARNLSGTWGAEALVDGQPIAHQDFGLEP